MGSGASIMLGKDLQYVEGKAGQRDYCRCNLTMFAGVSHWYPEDNNGMAGVIGDSNTLSVRMFGCVWLRSFVQLHAQIHPVYPSDPAHPAIPLHAISHFGYLQDDIL